MNLRTALALPLLAVTALALWAVADIAREADALKRLSVSEANARAEVAAGRLHYAEHLGILMAGQAENADDLSGLVENSRRLLAEVTEGEWSVYLYDETGQLAGGAGAVSPPSDLLRRSIAELQFFPALTNTFDCPNGPCTGYLRPLSFRKPGPLAWALVTVALGPIHTPLPSAAAPMVWRRIDQPSRAPWLGAAQNTEVWFTTRQRWLAQHGLEAEVHRPNASWLALWWRHNGARFLLLAAALVALFGLAGLLAQRLANILRQHRKIQAVLASREQQLRAVFDIVPDAFLVHDRGRVIFANPGAVRTFRADSLEKLIGWSLFEALAGSDRRIAEERTRLIQEDGVVPEPARMAARRLDGTSMTIRVQGRPIEFNGRRAVLSVVYDITDQAQIEAELMQAKAVAEAASKAKSEFLGHMSHELRTPLNSIIGFAELLEREHLGPLGAPKYVEYARDIIESGRHLLALINDVLDWSRAESGRLQPNDEEIDIGKMAQTCLRAISETAGSRGVAIANMLDDSAPVLLADPKMIRQVMLNLLSNAVKFTPSGGKVRIEGGRLQGGHWECRITDTGIGIAGGDLRRIFEPFVQADGSHQRSYEGTGLGLPLSRRLMELHGGRLWLESEPGKGTVAHLEFPAARVIEDTAAHVS